MNKNHEKNKEKGRKIEKERMTKKKEYVNILGSARFL